MDDKPKTEPCPLLTPSQVLGLGLGTIAAVLLLLFPPMLFHPWPTPVTDLTPRELNTTYWPIEKPLLLVVGLVTAAWIAVCAERR